MARLRIASIPLLMVCAWGRADYCAADVAESSEIWGAISNGLQMSLRLEKGEYLVSQDFTGTARIRNTTHEIIHLAEYYPDADFEVIATTTDGKSVPLTEYGKRLLEPPEILGVRTAEIPAGGQIERTVSVGKRFRFEAGQTYFIRMKRKFQLPQERGFGEVVSNVVTIRIH